MHWEPRCLLTTKDYTILEVTLNRALARGDWLVPMLRRKLSRATVVFREDIPSHAVTINSRAVYRVGAGEVETRTVVHGEENEIMGMTIPITTPRGLALLGMSAGEATTFQRPDGSTESIHVEQVAYQPEAAQRDVSNANVVPIGRGKAAPTHVPAVISLSARRRSVQPRLPESDGDDPGPAAA